MRDKGEEEDDVLVVNRPVQEDGEDGARDVVGVCVYRGACGEVEEGVEERRQQSWRNRPGGVEGVAHGCVVEEVVEDAVGAGRVGDVPDDSLAVAHLEPVEVEGRVWVCEGPCGFRILGGGGGEGGGAEDGGADPEGVAVGGGQCCGGGWEGEEVGENGGAVIPVEGEGGAVG